ncbi:MAG: hypothetical protein LBM08_04845 [Dysgonamonadaceae bacterium]|jgi:hypothetical protein|nr:hypothetical protein [Dysgonamonadaceae bacterium]
MRVFVQDIQPSAIGKSEFPYTDDLMSESSHDISSSSAVQSLFKLYLERMETLTGSGDTLFIGTFDEFRKNQPELTKMLLEGDSICFDICKGSGGLKNYATTVYLPIKY